MKHVELLEQFFRNPGRFSVLILGERGTGKTKWVKEIAEKKIQTKVIVANCASFADDTMAESELFGHAKGSFTGANADKNGLFKEADNGILFMDEVHTLSLRVQEKIMTSLQTEGSGKHKGKFCIRRLGDNSLTYVSVRPVFASNLKLEDLRKRILPDLYDRISQLVVEIPSLKNSKLAIYDEFTKVWHAMQFKEFPLVPSSQEFKKWLNRISLEGNYRTLQSIAISWHQGRLIFKDKSEDSVFDFVREQFSKFHSTFSPVQNQKGFNFRKGFSKKQLELEYQKALYDWAISKDGYGSVAEAQKGLSHVRLHNPHKKQPTS